jgi:diadenosine tetraphosphate (Ap4A) HIT family hydrolase
VTDCLFCAIVAGDIPADIVLRNDDVVAFLTIAPINPGHLLVVPVAEVDLWTDVEPATWARMAEVQTALGRALLAAFDQQRVGVIIAGLEVPHCHVHLIPIDDESDLSFARADAHATPEALDAAADRIRSALRADGHDAHVAG